MPSVPSPQVVLGDLSQLIPTLYDAIEAATAYARDFFEKREESVDTFFTPGLVRYITKQCLKAAGQTAEEEDVFDVGVMANNGLLLTYGTYRIRILKADGGDLPVAGPSKARQAFYHQLSLGLPGEEQWEKVNLVVLWDVDREYLFKELLLACPKGGGTSKSSIEKHWICPIPHPIADVSATPIRTPDTAEIVTPADLPITFLRDEETESEGKGA
ncbi:MAG: hypothetical protein M1377_00890 [Deltaproteobacteria bacterium]|nr:hypothetical protein [Deltaproteobacteria bacterium]